MCRNDHKDCVILVSSKIGVLPVRLLAGSQGHQFYQGLFKQDIDAEVCICSFIYMQSFVTV